MTALSTSDTDGLETPRKVIHPLWVRVTHWINAIAIVLMMLSGWQIYNASPLFPFTFSPSITIGGWLAGALLWHFAAMWLFVDQRSRLCRARHSHRPFPAQAASDLAARRWCRMSPPR